ncbi:cupin domain-containing protein [Amycolatopsis nalaikhensis]|uniref:Cupin domain-containing protein n=1 Tax=Amycolatopsis nalaikhensis TaxID=715472 RepID=A0ABY8XNQ1_9PSEU|nr:cupin domain-containing protein [Amycolatopsis sp. 2-2]WIV57177.1 cupin domain-containing protein [Amycolatopsis sp. 2-2]
MFENYDLFSTLIQLRPDGVAEAADRREALRGTDGSLWSVGAFHAEDDRAVHSDVWERHTRGHEVLVALSGTFRVHLRDEGLVATLTAGRSFIVPPGRWHRLAVEEPGDLLSITPRAGTEHEKADVAATREPAKETAAP